MNRMKDSKGREWEIPVNVLTIGRVRQEHDGLNLLEVVMPENALLDRLAGDPIELAQVLFLLCRDQIDREKIAAEDFYTSLSRDCLDDGLRAILDGAVNFSPSGLRAAYRKVLDKSAKLEETQHKRLAALIDSTEFDAMLDSAMTRALDGTSPTGSPSSTTGVAGSLPESSASNRAKTRKPRLRR
jgi:hypothetical protein